MKEATGELNMTVITIVAIGLILVVFTVLILPAIKKNITTKARCAGAICDTCIDGHSQCHDEDGDFPCPCKNESNESSDQSVDE